MTDTTVLDLITDALPLRARLDMKKDLARSRRADPVRWKWAKAAVITHLNDTYVPALMGIRDAAEEGELEDLHDAIWARLEKGDTYTDEHPTRDDAFDLFADLLKTYVVVCDAIHLDVTPRTLAVLDALEALRTSEHDVGVIVTPHAASIAS